MVATISIEETAPATRCRLSIVEPPQLSESFARIDRELCRIAKNFGKSDWAQQCSHTPLGWIAAGWVERPDAEATPSEPTRPSGDSRNYPAVFMASKPRATRYDAEQELLARLEVVLCK